MLLGPNVRCLLPSPTHVVRQHVGGFYLISISTQINPYFTSDFHLLTKVTVSETMIKIIHGLFCKGGPEMLSVPQPAALRRTALWASLSAALRSFFTADNGLPVLDNQDPQTESVICCAEPNQIWWWVTGVTTWVVFRLLS